ncbi:MAG: FitA-like ribbon-helix-helix domain-containing protein [Phycisphaeraceae bacterium]
MPDLLIRNLDPVVLERLKRRAKASGRSLQSETKGILEQAAGRTLDEALQVAAGWRKKLGKRPTDSAQALREDRGR